MYVRWNPYDPLKIDGKLGNNLEMSLAAFQITFKVWNTSETEKKTQAHLAIFMYRNIWNHVLVTYFPSSLFVIISWGSFIVSPDMVPGRMVLLVTTLLTLVTMFNSIRQNVPGSSGVKPVELYVMTCIVFVASALLEYATVLLRLRYHKAWKRKSKPVPVNKEERVDYLELTVPRRLFVSRQANTATLCSQEETRSSKKLARIFAKGSTLYRRLKRWTSVRDGIEDMVSLVVFPVCFVIFNIIYWYTCLARREERVSQMENDVVGPGVDAVAAT